LTFSCPCLDGKGSSVRDTFRRVATLAPAFGPRGILGLVLSVAPSVRFLFSFSARCAPALLGPIWWVFFPFNLPFRLILFVPSPQDTCSFFFSSLLVVARQFLFPLPRKCRWRLFVDRFKNKRNPIGPPSSCRLLKPVTPFKLIHCCLLLLPRPDLS